MTQPFVAEIRLFSYGALPHGWLPCDGRLLQIALHQPLFSILGFRQGGDFIGTFALPALASDLQPLTFAIATEGLYPPRTNETQMDNPFIGEIRIFSGNFVPAGWTSCDGRELNAAEYAELYALIGHSFGGSGSTFNLPNLRDRASSYGLNFIIAVNGQPPGL